MPNAAEHDGNHPMLPADIIPSSFIEQHRECCSRFMNWQTVTILSNIALFQAPLDEDTMEGVRQSRQHHAIAYVNRFCLRAIDDCDRVVPTAAKQVQMDMNIVIWYNNTCSSVCYCLFLSLLLFKASDF